METKVIFIHDEPTRRWVATVEGVADSVEARQAFNACCLTVMELNPNLFEHHLVTPAANGAFNIVPAVLKDQCDFCGKARRLNNCPPSKLWLCAECRLISELNSNEIEICKHTESTEATKHEDGSYSWKCLSCGATAFGDRQAASALGWI